MWSLDQSFDTSAGRVVAGVAGDGAPLVLAHCWPWSSYAWHRVVRRLTERFRVHFYDMPDYGQSERDATRASGLDVQGRVFCELLDHWRLGRPAVVAHDFGGTVTLQAHLLHGRDFARLVLTNMLAPRPWGSAFFDRVKAHVDAFAAAFEPRLDAMRCPVAVLWGEDGPWIPLARGRQLSRRLGNAPFHRLAGLGHLPRLEAPARVADALRDALAPACEVG